MAEASNDGSDPQREVTDFDIYQAACAEGMQKVYKANVIVVGHQGTGKTHLCRNLLGEDFTEDDLVTNGLEVSGCILEKNPAAGTTRLRKENTSNSSDALGLIKVEEDDQNVTQMLEKNEGHPDIHTSLSIWDFGDQHVFYHTHQYFLNFKWGAVFLFVFDLTKELNDPIHIKRGGTMKESRVDILTSTAGDFLKFWQNSIHTHTEIVKGPVAEFICPRILLVGTHRDKLGHTEEERKKAVEERFSEIQEYLLRRSAHDLHVQPYWYAVNNCDPQDAEIQELREGIRKTVKAQPYWGEEQPLKYVLLEKRLKEISETQKCLSLEEVHEQGRQHGFVGYKMVLHFLKFYSELGELVFFNEDDTRSIVILDPHWLIDAFASLITVEKYHNDSNLEAMGYWGLLNDKGELDERLIDIVWQEKAELKENKTILLRICQRFDLLFELPEEATNSQMKRYLVPCLLKSHPNPEGHLKIPECPPEGYLEMQKIPPLYLMFDDGFCPPALFHCLVVCCYRKWSSHDKKPYCNYVSFKVDGIVHAILELWNIGDGTFRLVVGSLKNDVNIVEDNIAFTVISYITQELDRLIDAYFPYLKCSIAFRFPQGLEKLTEDLKADILKSDDVCTPGCPEVIHTAPYRKWLRNNGDKVLPSTRIDAVPHDHDKLLEEGSHRGYTTEDALSSLPAPTKRVRFETVKRNKPTYLEEKIQDEPSKISPGDASVGDGVSDLHLAAMRNDYQGIRSLIDEGADINLQDNQGRSCLHIAADNGCIHVVKWLIYKGADVNVQDKKGRSSIYLALEKGHGDIATMLFDAGAHLLGLRDPVPNEDEIKMGRIIQDKASKLAEEHSSLCGIYPACTFQKGGAKKVPYFVIACNDKEKKTEFPSQVEGYAVLVKEGSVTVDKKGSNRLK